jgi:deoxyribose-phosphate aldolase
MMTHSRNAGRDQARLRAALEATRLSYGLTDHDVRALVGTATMLGVRAVCVPPAFVTLASSVGAASLEIATVANFPTGDRPRRALEREVIDVSREGADHIDLVLPGALIADRRWTELAAHVRVVREWAGAGRGGDVAIKAILETAAWDEGRVRGAAGAAVDGGAAWLKTSTGFHPAGGATLAAVNLLREVAPPEVGVKASGGIRTRRQAISMLDAGADRIGTSSEAAILQGEDEGRD